MNNISKELNEKAIFFSNLNEEAKKEYFIVFFVSNVINELKLKRKEAGLTQKDVSSRMGIKQSYISKIENLEKIPQLDTVAKYAQAISMSYEEAYEFSHNLVGTANCLFLEEGDFEPISIVKEEKKDKYYKNGYAANKALSVAF